ncbi:MAG: DUF362 domain-containing protein [Spirochaetes bacterium]|nr:DUF362 domain-containing protein [Spirochaetota bacterium]
MAPTVYFSSIENKKSDSPLNKIKQLLNKCNVSKLFKKDELIAIKVHFGELGNTSFIRPIYLRPVIEILKNIQVKPFLTDTNTLYVGMRTNSVDHLHNAFVNGFNYSTLQVPVVIADGLRGENTQTIEVNLDLLKNVKLANDIINADGMIVISHFKGHEVSGFGGAIKNISMGCASRQGKLVMHSQTKPVVKQKFCTACGRCVSNCQVGAIKIKEKAFITKKCVGCTRCIAICPENAISIQWNESAGNTQRKMVEYAYGLNKALKSKIIYINILMSMSPACDCYPGNDKPVANDIGFLASCDPVAIDKASYDLVIKEANEDPFKKIYPDIDPDIQFEHTQKIGFGSVEYKLVKID